MACFTVPAGEAIVTTIDKKVIDKKEIKEGTSVPKAGIPFSRKLKWLTNLLWGFPVLPYFMNLQDHLASYRRRSLSQAYRIRSTLEESCRWLL